MAAKAFAQSHDPGERVHDAQHFAVASARPAFGPGDQQTAIIGAKIERGIDVPLIAIAMRGRGQGEFGNWRGSGARRDRRAQDRALGGFDHAFAFGGLIPPDQILLPHLDNFHPGSTGALRVNRLNLPS